MSQDNLITQLAHQLAAIPFRLFAKRPYIPPQKALILHPCCLSHILLATPLLARLNSAYPQAQFDWAVSDLARPAIVTNPRITTFLHATSGAIEHTSRADRRALTELIAEQNYDTCFILGPSPKLSQIAWRAGIQQRIGLHLKGNGFANTIPIQPPKGEQHAAARYLAIADTLGVAHASSSKMEFYPRDADYTAVTQRLIDEIEWLGERPLAILHPGGGVFADEERRWPLERFVLLGNHIARQHNASVIMVGDEQDHKMAVSIEGMMSGEVINWAGKISLGELGALCALADLYVGNDTGPTHISVAMGCPTVAIFGPTDPAFSAPFAPKSEQLVILWNGSAERPFNWENGVQIKEATQAVDRLMKHKKQNP